MAKKKTAEPPRLAMANLQFPGEHPPRIGVPTAELIEIVPGPAPDEDGASEPVASSSDSEAPDHPDTEAADAVTMSDEPELEEAE